MIKLTNLLLLVLSLFISGSNVSGECINFSVSQGTGCQWMCNYCSNQLGTNNYYFTDGVCTYQQGVGCVGNPLSGKQYTCCSVNEEEIIEEERPRVFRDEL